MGRLRLAPKGSSRARSFSTWASPRPRSVTGSGPRPFCPSIRAYTAWAVERQTWSPLTWLLSRPAVRGVAEWARGRVVARAGERAASQAGSHGSYGAAREGNSHAAVVDGRRPPQGHVAHGGTLAQAQHPGHGQAPRGHARRREGAPQQAREAL